MWVWIPEWVPIAIVVWAFFSIIGGISSMPGDK